MLETTFMKLICHCPVYTNDGRQWDAVVAHSVLNGITCYRLLQKTMRSIDCFIECIGIKGVKLGIDRTAQYWSKKNLCSFFLFLKCLDSSVFKYLNFHFCVIYVL